MIEYTEVLGDIYEVLPTRLYSLVLGYYPKDAPSRLG